MSDDTSETGPSSALAATAQPPVSPFDASLDRNLLIAGAAAKLFGEQIPASASKIGRFSILRRLGQGAMGVVYVAYDEELDRRVAIKLLREADSRATERFRREAQAMARLSHPNVAQIYEVGLWRGRVYLALEYIEGLTLGAWLERAPRSLADIVAVLIQAGEGLAAAHEAGLVHRDFKPDNVIVGEDGRVRVLDFGLAGVDHERPAELSPEPERARPATAKASLLELSLTRTGALLGTPAYMSPEQLRGQRSGAAGDCFGFCVVAYEALYGARPFAGETVVALRRAIEARAIEPPSRERHVPAPLRAAICSGLVLAPGERPALPALLDALSPYAPRDEKLAAPDPRAIESRATLLGIAAWIAVLGLGLACFPPRGDDPGDDLMFRWVTTSSHTPLELFAVDALLLALLGITGTALLGGVARRRLRGAELPVSWARGAGLSWPWVSLASTLVALMLGRAYLLNYDPQLVLQHLAIVIWLGGLALSLPLGLAALERLEARRGLPPLLAVGLTLALQLLVALALMLMTAWVPMRFEFASIIVAVGIPGILAAGVGSSLAVADPRSRAAR